MRILYATDGSQGALNGARFLAALPLWDCTLSILTVVKDGGVRDGEAALASAREALSHSTAGLETEVRFGNPMEQILHAAEEHPTDLIVLGASGHTALARFFVGSVAERVARHAPCSVLVARDLRAGLRRVILGLDQSESSLAAAEWLARLPLPPECEVRLLTLIPNLRLIAQEHFALMPPLAEQGTTLDDWMRQGADHRMQQALDLFREGGKQAVTEVRSADAAAGLLDAAHDQDAGLLVLGSHGAGPVERFLLGSVSEKVLRHAPCSVLVVKRPAQHS